MSIADSFIHPKVRHKQYSCGCIETQKIIEIPSSFLPFTPSSLPFITFTSLTRHITRLNHRLQFLLFCSHGTTGSHQKHFIRFLIFQVKFFWFVYRYYLILVDNKMGPDAWVRGRTTNKFLRKCYHFLTTVPQTSLSPLRTPRSSFRRRTPRSYPTTRQGCDQWETPVLVTPVTPEL